MHYNEKFIKSGKGMKEDSKIFNNNDKRKGPKSNSSENQFCDCGIY